MTSLLWFRQDLRLQDNPALKAALEKADDLIFLYILDDSKNNEWKIGAAQRWWLHHSLISLTHSLKEYGLSLVLRKGDPYQIILELTQQHRISHLYWNRLYEPIAVDRDKRLKQTLREQGRFVESFNGSLLREPWEVSNKSNQPYKVFTPFWKHFKELGEPRAPLDVSLKGGHSTKEISSDTLDDWGLLPRNPDWASDWLTYWTPGEKGAQESLHTFLEHGARGYKTARDFPGIEGTSRLSPHLHFGEISPHQLWRQLRLSDLETPLGRGEGDSYLRQLGWREFCISMLYYFPQFPTEPFRQDFKNFHWGYDAESLEKWQKGMTGYPLVDAGMRQLWKTGWMHNRVRMVVASFLTKDLLLPWTEGERWFWDTLVDADLANNAAGWQWVAGCGADAQPYFRIFNPVQQSLKFDPEGHYIHQWVPELRELGGKALHAPWEASPYVLSKAGVQLGVTYPYPLVDHSTQRQKALKLYDQSRKIFKSNLLDN